MYLLNAFSLNMLPADTGKIHYQTIPERLAAAYAAYGVVSAVGHADMAAVFSSILGREIPCNRTTVTLQKGVRALVGQYSGPRLPEGAKELPEGASIKWIIVHVD